LIFSIVFIFIPPFYNHQKILTIWFQVNFSSGRYFSGNGKEAAAHLPFDAGFEVTDAFHISICAVG
jgi:hypothetical protein